MGRRKRSKHPVFSDREYEAIQGTQMRWRSQKLYSARQKVVRVLDAICDVRAPEFFTPRVVAALMDAAEHTADVIGADVEGIIDLLRDRMLSAAFEKSVVKREEEKVLVRG